MADGRRHSVEIPISRTLIALRRVKSLRDPSTSSMSKFTALLDNVNWETDSNNGISLQFTDSQQEGTDANPNGLLCSKHLGFEKKGEGLSYQLNHLDGVETINSHADSKNVERLNFYGLDEDQGFELACLTPDDPMEDVDSSSGQIRAWDITSNRNHQCQTQKKFNPTAGDVPSSLCSPFLSTDDGLSNCGHSLFLYEDMDVIDPNHGGCGISHCWSRTPKLKESDGGDHLPLLSGDVNDLNFNKSNDSPPSLETPRSLSQKFKPKSFHELVGQNSVVISLLSAISRGKITSFYLFHGPRGTGKTSTARIFAAALNCLSLENHKPCGLCRECVSFFSGRSRNVKEINSVKINQRERLRSFIKSAVVSPTSSRFKILIIDECHLLRAETWPILLSSLESFSQNIVFIMISPDLDKLPRNAVSRSQKYHFQRIKDADIASRLGKICVEEGLEYDRVALDFIATKSSGSLRDAEMMLDQLSLLGKRITVSVAYELIGVVSDDELLDLLDLALSSETSNTVKKARELMRSKIDPMQLTTQLANLIMDILVGKCPEGSSEARKKFCTRHNSDEELQKLSHALKILSDTEKNLRASKNQTTWLTVALLQLSSVESFATSDRKLCLRSPTGTGNDEFCSISSEGESLKHPVTCSCGAIKSYEMEEEHKDCKVAIESLWKRVTELCQTDSFKNFLWKKGKLSSLRANQGLAIAELEFNHPRDVYKAEKSWKLIANSFQSILGCNVEIRVNLDISASGSKTSKLRRLLSSLFNCSHKIQQKPQSSSEQRSDSDHSEKPMMTVSALRSSEGNVLSTVTSSSRRSVSLVDGETGQYNAVSGQQSPCFPKTVRLQKLNASQMDSTSDQEESKRTQTYIRADDPYISLGNFENDTNNFQERSGPEKNCDLFCWRTPTAPVKKACQLPHKQTKSCCVLPCATAN